MIRAQYHFCNSIDGFRACNIRPLIELSKGFSVESILLDRIDELYENHWYAYERQVPTCHSISEHMSLIDVADLSYPIILSSEGRVMDGMHRVCKAVRPGEHHIQAVQFTADPEPDFVGGQPGYLPYEQVIAFSRTC